MILFFCHFAKILWESERRMYCPVPAAIDSNQQNNNTIDNRINHEYIVRVLQRYTDL
jgi:hypothetical protein